MSTSKYRIVSLDGGGVRGLVTAIMLQAIQKHFEANGENFLDSVDFLAGTSTGGLLALAIAKDIKLLDRMKDIYANESKSIFEKASFKSSGGFLATKYTNEPLDKKLYEIFGDMRLEDLSKKVLLPTFDLDNDSDNPESRHWKPKLFHNFPPDKAKQENNEDQNHTVVEVGLYTTAAPTFFPSVKGYIDGGVYANNPSMCAIAQTQDQRYHARTGATDSRVSLDNIVMLSLGTGLNLQHLRHHTIKRGILRWIQPLIQIIFDGTTGIGDYQCKQLLNEHQYRRLNPTFIGKNNKPKYVAMDATSPKKIAYMIQIAESYTQSNEFRDTLDWMGQHWF
ncbi:MAG: patatin-like phospholipase family protein [Bacteroidota bacterium]